MVNLKKLKRLNKVLIYLHILFICACISSKDCNKTYSDGRILMKCCEEVDLKIGYKYCHIFDSNKVLIEEGYYDDSLKAGPHKYYKNGKLIAIVEYLILKDSINYTYHNRDYIIYESGDTIKEKSGYYTLIYKDTINTRDTLKATFNIEAPCFKYSKLEILAQEPNDEENVRLIRSDDRRIEYQYIPKNHGRISIFCVLNEHEFIPSDSGFTPTGKFRKYYAKIDFFVK